MDTLQGLLSDHGISLKNYRPGGSSKILCPKCGGGRTKEISLSVTVEADGSGAVWNCKRGSCGWASGVRLQDARRPAGNPLRKYRQPLPHAPEKINYPNELYKFFSERKISEDTVAAFGCYVVNHQFPGELGWHDAIVFPYLLESRLVNRKYRALKSKHITAQDFEAYPTLFNFDACESDDEIIFVEGEPDVMAVHESGFPQCVTLKDGAPAKLKADDDPARDTDKRFAALTTHAEFLGRVKKIILAGDMDPPGLVLREELARRLGRHRCWVVTWPEGCKDACDVLRAFGTAMVQQCICAAEQYPIEGVHDINGAALDSYLESPPPLVMRSGIGSLDKILKFPGEGRVITVTGIPNAGKTAVLINVMVGLMRRHDRRFLVFSPEAQPFEEFAVQCAQVLVGKPARPLSTIPEAQAMTRQERIDAGNWLKPRLAFLSTDSEDKPPTIDWILERARDCVMRLGTTDLMIDPFNELEQEESGLSETKFIGRSLQRARSFGLRYGCNSWIAAHPAKMRPAKPGEAIPAPGPYDINGSAHWANKSDIGITIHTPKDKTLVILWKSRYSRWGRKGNQCELIYDVASGRYSTPPGDPGT
jgi:twinkle protein